MDHKELSQLMKSRKALQAKMLVDPTAQLKLAAVNARIRAIQEAS